jgi:hypothetical protein
MATRDVHVSFILGEVRLRPPDRETQLSLSTRVNGLSAPSVGYLWDSEIFKTSKKTENSGDQEYR